MDEAIDLGLPLVVEHAPELKSKLLDLAGASSTLTLDLRWSEKVDTTGLQLILATETFLSSAGGGLVLWPGAAFESAVRTAGLQDKFEALYDCPTAETW